VALSWWVAQPWHNWVEHVIFALLYALPMLWFLRRRYVPQADLLATLPPVIFFFARAEREVEQKLEATQHIKDEFAWMSGLIVPHWPQMQLLCFVAPSLAMALLWLICRVRRR